VVVAIVEDGVTVTASVEAEGLVPQPFTAVTVILPPDAPAVAVIDIVPAPAVMVHPAGTVQL
jgi:hypothetical protein